MENFQKKSHFRGTKCRVEAKHNREAVVVSTKHFVKRPSKLGELIPNNSTGFTRYMIMCGGDPKPLSAAYLEPSTREGYV